MARCALSQAEWQIVEPLLPAGGKGGSPGGRPASDQRHLPTCCGPARLGATCRNATGRTRRCTIASTDGPAKAYGWRSSKRWRRARRTRCTSSTVRSCALTSTRPAQKRGAGSRPWPFSWRTEHQDPRRRRSGWPARAVPDHPGPGLRQDRRRCSWPSCRQRTWSPTAATRAALSSISSPPAVDAPTSRRRVACGFSAPSRQTSIGAASS
jgi:transposase